MSVLKRKVLWYGNKGLSNPEEITDDISLSIDKGLDAKSNNVTIVLKNSIDRFDGTRHQHKWIDNTNKIKIKKDDVIEIYLKYSDDNTPIDTGSSDDLITTCDVVDVTVTLDSKKSYITIGCIDKTFSLLNKIWTEAYTTTQNLTAPEIIKNIVRNVVETGESGLPKGYEKDAEGNTGILYTNGQGLFGIDARLESDGGFIEDTRPDDSAFPTIHIGKLFKPIYEWIDELSQTNYTNSSTEIANGTEVAQLKYIYRVDKLNRLHWFYPTNSEDYTINIGTVTPDGEVRELKLKNSVFDVVNCVFYNAGESLDNNTAILDFFYDKTSEEPKLKIKYIPWIDIAINYRQQAVNAGDITINEDGTITFNTSSGTTPWGDVFTSANDYRDSFYDIANADGQARARRYTSKRGSPRWKGTLTLKGKQYDSGQLINLTATQVGIQSLNIRIIKVTHQVNKNSWVTTLNLEEDEKAIGT